MKKCNTIMKEEHIKIKKRDIKVEYKYLHRNCKYVGLWEKQKDRITIDANLSPEDMEGKRGHEAFHSAMCLMRQALGGKGALETGFCYVCTAQDDDPLFESLLIEYGIGNRRPPQGLKDKFLDLLWYQIVKIMRYIASMRLNN